MGLSGKKRHRAIVSKVLPHPSRFHLVWSKTQGSKPLFVWEGVPPSRDFVSLGHICTTTSSPPPLDSVHCAPRTWVTKSDATPQLVWEDTGTAGRPGSLWSVTSMNLLVGTDGHNPPKGPFYEFSFAKWLCTNDFRAIPMKEG